jgi:hypothetical protein
MTARITVEHAIAEFMEIAEAHATANANLISVASIFRPQVGSNVGRHTVAPVRQSGS